MQAFVLDSYGAPLTWRIVETPVPGPDEVLIRVRATSVNPYDWHFLKGEPRIARLMPGGLGLRGPRHPILGCDISGTVESIGAEVIDVQPGDDVFALLPAGGFGEYVVAPARLVVPKPANLSHEEAAAVPMAGVTALLAVRDVGGVQPGHRVLVNGASGGVGTFAVQIAAHLGAKVTAVCGPRNVDLVSGIGAHEVIDYSRDDFTAQIGEYDVLVDIAGNRSAWRAGRALTSGGTLVAVGGPAGRWIQPAGHVVAAVAVATLIRRRVKLADTVAADQAALLAELARWLEEGAVRPVIDRVVPLAELPEAITYQEAGHAHGKVVVTVS